MMKKLLALAALALASMSANALYYCKCDTGAHGSCEAGSDSNNGSTPTLARSTLPDSSALEVAAAGTTHNLCEGGAWVDSSVPGWFIQNANVTRTSPLTIQSYAPSSGATGRPKLQSSSGAGNQWIFGGFCMSGCPAPAHGGYVLRGLEITKSGSPSGEGIVMYGSSRWVTLENIVVSNWANGMNISTDQNIRNVTVRFSSFSNNCQNGIVGNATDFTVEDSTFANNNPASAGCGTFLLQHGVYIGGATPQQRIIFRRNTFTNNSLTSGVCGSGNMTFRGMVDQLTLEENVIETPSGNNTCYGISIIDGYSSFSECVRRAVIRGNRIINVGANSMALKITPGALIENNSIVRLTSTGFHTGIGITNPGDTVQDCTAGGTIVRNNSAYIASGSTGDFINIAAGTGHTVVNNSVQVTSGAGSTNCWSMTALSNFTLWNNNWCYEQSSGQYSPTYSTLSAAQAAGFDVNGGNTDPQYAAVPSAGNNWSLAVQSTSPLRSAGNNANKAPRDIVWCQRDNTPDVGSYEYGGTPCLTVRSVGQSPTLP